MEFNTVEEAQKVLSIKNHFIGEYRISCSPYINKREAKMNKKRDHRQRNPKKGPRSAKNYDQGGHQGNYQDRPHDHNSRFGQDSNFEAHNRRPRNEEAERYPQWNNFAQDPNYSRARPDR